MLGLLISVVERITGERSSSEQQTCRVRRQLWGVEDFGFAGQPAAAKSPAKPRGKLKARIGGNSGNLIVLRRRGSLLDSVTTANDRFNIKEELVITVLK